MTAVKSERKLTIARAICEAIAQSMRDDQRVFVMGEDIGKLGGVFGTTRGLFEEFGPERIRDTPISETAFIGAAVGAASDGMRPIVERKRGRPSPFPRSRIRWRSARRRP